MSEFIITRESVLAHARQFKTRLEWKAACKKLRDETGTCLLYRWARCQGTEFYKECKAHMAHMAIGAHKFQPLYAKWRELTDDEILAAARQYKTRRKWRAGSPLTYRAAIKIHGSSSDFYAKCTEHMLKGTLAEDAVYSIYAFEFTDNVAYVGLSFKPERRKKGHLAHGLVFKHIATCPTYEWKVLQADIQGPCAASQAEKEWIEKYAVAGWKLLNKNHGGAIGGVSASSRYEHVTDAEIIADAQKYPTKNAWKNSHSLLRKQAKKRGIFNLCVAHMPKRASQPPRHFSAESRAKMAASAQRRAADPEWRKRHSEQLRGKMLGVKLTEEHKAKISAAHMGKVFSAESRAKMSAAKSGKPLSAEHRAKLAAIATGKERGAYKMKLTEAEWHSINALRGLPTTPYPAGTRLCYVALTQAEKTSIIVSRATYTPSYS